MNCSSTDPCVVDPLISSVRETCHSEAFGFFLQCNSDGNPSRYCSDEYKAAIAICPCGSSCPDGFCKCDECNNCPYCETPTTSTPPTSTTTIEQEWPNPECSDLELGHECGQNLEDKFQWCIFNCESYECIQKCQRDHATELRKCPCFPDCPLGCDGCHHDICYQECDDSSLGNQCLWDLAIDQLFCDIFVCDGGGQECLKMCADAYERGKLECPCQLKCPGGCKDCVNHQICTDPSSCNTDPDLVAKKDQCRKRPL